MPTTLLGGQQQGEQQDQSEQDQTQPEEGHPGGTANERDDLPDPPDETPPGAGHPGGTDNERDDLPDPPDTTLPGEGHPGGTDDEQDDLPDPPEHDEGDETGGSQTPAEGEGDGAEEAEEEESDTDCLSGTFVSGSCQPRTEGEPSGADAEGEEESEEADASSHIPNETEIDGRTVADVVGSTEVTFLCQLAGDADSDATPNVLRGQKLIEALGKYGLAVICGDGAQSYWHYVLDGDTSPKAFAEFGIHVGLEIVCGAITASTVGATSLSGPVALAVGTYVLIKCGEAAGEVSRWIVDCMDYLVQRLSECDGVIDDDDLTLISMGGIYAPWAHIGRCLVHDDGSDDSDPEPEAGPPSAHIAEVPPVCARIDGDWLEVTWGEVSAQSTSRLRWWTVFWSVHMDSGGSIQERDYWLATNVRSFRIPKPPWVTGGSLAEADWTVGVIASAGVGGFEPWESQRVTDDGGWAGSNGVGEC